MLPGPSRASAWACVRMPAKSNGAGGASDPASGLPAAPNSPFSLDTGMRPVSNACPGKSGEVSDVEVNAHLGNPGLITPHRPANYRGSEASYTQMKLPSSSAARVEPWRGNSPSSAVSSPQTPRESSRIDVRRKFPSSMHLDTGSVFLWHSASLHGHNSWKPSVPFEVTRGDRRYMRASIGSSFPCLSDRFAVQEHKWTRRDRSIPVVSTSV